MDGPQINNTNLGMTSYVSGLRSSLKSLYHIGPYLKVRVCAERKRDLQHERADDSYNGRFVTPM